MYPNTSFDRISHTYRKYWKQPFSPDRPAPQFLPPADSFSFMAVATLTASGPTENLLFQLELLRVQFP